MHELSLDAAQGVMVVGWRTVEDGLLLRVRGQEEEVRLKCRCGRCHWIVREQFGPREVRLLVTCHNCGTRLAFPMEGVALPSA